MTRSEQVRIIVVGVVVPALMGIVGAVLVVLAMPDLPDPIAVHWGLTGEPDGFGSPWIAALLPLISIFYALFALLAVRSGTREGGITLSQRGILALGPYLAVVLSVVGAGSALMQRGLADAKDAPSILPLVAVSFLAGAVAAVGAWFALPRHRGPVPVDPTTAPAIELTATERAVWMRRLEPGRSAGLLIIGGLGLAVTVGATIIWASAPLWNLLVWLGILALLALVVTSTLFWTVRVDGTGFTARSALGVPQYHVGVDEVEAAAVTTVIPVRDFGGWGLRLAGGKRTGIVVRAGEAIEIKRTNGTVLTVTVDGAEQGAALLNGLVARSHKQVG